MADPTTPPATLRVRALAVVAFGLGLAGCLLTAEVALRFMPYNHGLRAVPVTLAQPIFSFEPTRASVYSKGWNFQLVNRVRTNNAGFVNDRDYDRASSTPLLAIVGDSYIEALMVPYAMTVQGRLAQALSGTGRVYSFAASGAALPQYLVWARHARDTYRPAMMLISVIANDLAGSLFWDEPSPGLWRFDRGADGSVQWRLIEHRPTLFRRVLRHSSLASYLALNATTTTAPALDAGTGERRWVGNIEAVSPEDRLRDYRWAIDRFIEYLPEYTGLAPDRIVLSLDGMRPHTYGTPDAWAFAATSTWGTMRDYLRRRAEERGIVVIDLEPLFRARFARAGTRFEFPIDMHWNEAGHEVLADAVTHTPAFRAVFVDAR